MSEVPYGCCHCGCGEKTNISAYNDKRSGAVKGEPRRFLFNHHSRRTPFDYLEGEKGCWLWQRCLTKDGYGKTTEGGRSGLLAHRVFYERYVGPIPEGLEIDHLCKVRNCVNPAHLEVVTRTQNIRRSDVAKLNVITAAELRNRFQNGEPVHVLAKEFGMTWGGMNSVAKGKFWTTEVDADV